MLKSGMPQTKQVHARAVARPDKHVSLPQCDPSVYVPMWYARSSWARIVVEEAILGIRRCSKSFLRQRRSKITSFRCLD